MLLDKSIKELNSLLKQKEISSVDLVKESYERIEKFDNMLHSFITVRKKKDILKEAEQKDNQRSSESSPIFGIPFSMKDIYITQGIQTTAGSEVLGNFIPPYNATVYEKLREKGALLIGKNNLDAWG